MKLGLFPWMEDVRLPFISLPAKKIRGELLHYLASGGAQVQRPRLTIVNIAKFVQSANAVKKLVQAS